MRAPKQPAVYILASRRYGALYIGVTSNLRRRVWEHKQGSPGTHTERYGVQKLVYYELCADMLAAIRREKQLKKWKRSWKIRLLAQFNPAWRDLYSDIL